MTAHDHREFVEGCYRCELNRDEALDDATSYAAPMICAAHGLSIDNCQGDCCEFMPPEDAVREARAEAEHLRKWTQRGLDALRTADGGWRPGVSIARVALQTALADPDTGEQS